MYIIMIHIWIISMGKVLSSPSSLPQPERAHKFRKNDSTNAPMPERTSWQWSCRGNILLQNSEHLLYTASIGWFFMCGASMCFRVMNLDLAWCWKHRIWPGLPCCHCAPPLRELQWAESLLRIHVRKQWRKESWIWVGFIWHQCLRAWIS